MTSATLPPASARPRFDRLDALRGAAMVWMAAFHFCFDLVYFRLWRQNFYIDPFWTLQRDCIVSLFLFCAGVGQAVAIEQRQASARFWRRWVQIAGCALLVSLGSWLMFPRSFISFGVLHCVAVALVLLRLIARPSRTSRWLWLMGVAALLAPLWQGDAWFDSRWTNWTGLVTKKPIAEDYVPLLPWFGVMCVGFVAGRWLLGRRRGWLGGAVPGALQPLAALGRWSLSFYMLHQPVLIGLLAALVWMRSAAA